MKGIIDVKNLWKRNQIMITALALMIAIAGYLNFTGKEISDEIQVTNSAQFEEAGADGAISDMSDVSLDEIDGIAGIYDISDEDIGTYAEIGSLDSEPVSEGADYLEQAGVDPLYVTDETADAAVQTEGAVQTDAAVQKGAALQTDETAKNTLVEETPGEAVFTSTTGISSLASANLIKEQTRARNKDTLLEIINSTAVSEESKQQAITSMIVLTDISEKECAAEILLEAKGFEDVVISISGNMADVMVGMSELSDAQRAQIEDIVKRKTGIQPENIIISPITEN